MHFSSKAVVYSLFLSSVPCSAFLRNLDESAAQASQVPLIHGVAPSIQRPNLVFAAGVSFAPYSFLGDINDGAPMTGFAKDVALGLKDVCELDISIVQTEWAECWGEDKIGPSLAGGHYHACTSYFHTAGARNRYLEFSDPILKNVNAAGILTRLDENGNPAFDGLSDLSGKTIVDVPGIAPSPENMAMVTNPCTGEPFGGYSFVTPENSSGDPNDNALRAVLEGKADAAWISADQAERFKCANAGKSPTWNCTLWDGLGETFAYVQTGLFDHAINGTTLTMSKIGSNLPSIVNPCIAKFLKTQSYFELCEKYDVIDECFKNEHFLTGDSEVPPFGTPTNELGSSDCDTGYCACDVDTQEKSSDGAF